MGLPAIRPPEVITPDWVDSPEPEHSDEYQTLERLLSDVADAAARLLEPELGPAAHEVGRWLRVRRQEIVAHLRPHRCTCPYGCDTDDW